MTRLHEEAGGPVCYSRETKSMFPDVEISPTGLVFHEYIRRCPENAELVVHPEVAATVREFLGHDMWLEVAGAVIADRSRPFFSWHMHVGGPDDGHYRRAMIFPDFDKSVRVTTLHYLNDIDDDNGPLLVYPRKVRDSTRPPHDNIQAQDWPGQVVLKVPRGSVVVLDQCTWHAARRKHSAGIRSFIGCYFRSPRAAPTEWVDKWLPTFTGGGDLLQSVLHRPA